MQDLSRAPDGKPSPWKQPVDWVPDTKWLSQKQNTQKTAYKTSQCQTDYKIMNEKDETKCMGGCVNQ